MWFVVSVGSAERQPEGNSGRGDGGLMMGLLMKLVE